MPYYRIVFQLALKNLLEHSNYKISNTYFDNYVKYKYYLLYIVLVSISYAQGDLYSLLLSNKIIYLKMIFSICVYFSIGP